jgi:hypothetical protein
MGAALIMSFVFFTSVAWKTLSPWTGGVDANSRSADF